MPIHDWTRVTSGIYHDFHQDWTIEIRRTLNRGLLPPGYFALADQRIGGPEPDFVTFQRGDRRGPDGGPAVDDRRPRLRRVARSTSEAVRYARKANRIAIHRPIGRVVAMIEVVSPGNKDSSYAVQAFVRKAVEFLQNGIHLLLIDPFPPTPRDPNGLPRLIWDELTDGEPYDDVEPQGGPLRVAAYDAVDGPTMYVDAPAVGGVWPDSPLFLEPGWYVEVPLEVTYEASWEVTPQPIRDLVTSPSA